MTYLFEHRPCFKKFRCESTAGETVRGHHKLRTEIVTKTKPQVKGIICTISYQVMSFPFTENPIVHIELKILKPKDIFKTLCVPPF